METRFTLKKGEKVFQNIHLIILILFLLLFSAILSFNAAKQFVLLLWCAGFFLLTGIRHLYLAELKGNVLQWISPFLEGGILYIIYLTDSSNTGLGLFILIVTDVVVDYEYSYGIIYTICGYLTYILSYMQLYAHLSLGNKILIFCIGAVQVTLYVGFAFLAKRYSIQSRQLQNTTAELHARMITTEQLAVLKERNRIAGEIHNTVGHQLTAALVQIEAAQMLMDKNPREAQNRLDIIKVQVREGLSELRKSIQAINAESEYEHFSEAVQRLQEQVQNHTGVQMVCKMDTIDGIKLQTKKVLYHVILESVTNGIRHGHCQKAAVTLSGDQDTLMLSVFNDGAIPEDYKPGYGLNQMKENLASLGGTLRMQINGDGWFGLTAKLPAHFQEGDADGIHQSDAGR